MPEHIGNITNLITKKTSAPKRSPSRIEVLEGRVGTLESALETVISELTALRSEVKGLSKPAPKAKATPKPTAKPTASPTGRKTSKRKTFAPWDDPEILKDIEASRPRILELLSDGQQITKQGCAETLGMDLTLAGRTLSYMMTVKKEIVMIEPPKTPDDPDPKKRFRLK